MTSSSPPQNETPLHIQDITEKLSKLLEDLNNAKDDYLNKSRADYLKVAQKESKEKQKVPEDSKKKGEVTQQVTKDGNTEKKEEMEIANQLDKANKELNYMIGAFKKLVAFEGDISKSLQTLERNVEDIKADLGRRVPDKSLKQAIERNLKVLRSNLTKVKILIPLQHQVSVAGSEERRYNLQTTVASKEVLPNPYEAKQIFGSGSFVKEFQDHYEALDNRHKLCLLCFAIFPENAEIRKRLLRFWWLGERLTEPKKDSAKKDPKKEGSGKTDLKKEDSGETGPEKEGSAKTDPKKEGSAKTDPKNEGSAKTDPKKEDSGQTDPKEDSAKTDPQEEENDFAKTDPKEEDFVNKTLKEFVEKGFIEPVTKKSKSRPTSYRMHPIIRSLIIKLAKEAKFFDYESQGNPKMEISASKKSCLVKSEQGTPSWFSKNFAQPESSDNQQQQKKPGKKEEQQQPESSDNQQQQKKPGKKEEQQQPESSDNQQQQQPESSDNQQQQKKPGKKEEEQQKVSKLEKQRQKDLEELQTLFNVSKQFPDLPVELFSKMRNIGVLYLGRWESTAERHIEVENAEFLDGLKNMKKLRFFSLQGISGISKLPKSLRELTNLIVLDLRACTNLEKLPKEIASLKRLIRLDLSECYLLDNIPKRLSQLSNLEVLKGFVVSKNSSCTVQHLAALRKLEKLSINVNSDNFNLDKEGDVFFKLTALRKLKIAWGAGGDKKSSNSKNGNNGKNGQNPKPRENGKKKGNPNPQSTADKSRAHPVSDAPAKSGGLMALQKLKMPWVSCGEGSSKSGDNKGAKKRESAAAKSGVSNKDENVKKNLAPKKENVMKNLEKLDLQCFPDREPPKWLAPHNLTGLNYLCIRGGELSKLPETESSMPDDKKCECYWEVKILRLKFLTDVKTNWKKLRTQFPKLEYLEKVKCPQITFCPCDANGVWKSDNPENFKNLPDMSIS